MNTGDFDKLIEKDTGTKSIEEQTLNMIEFFKTTIADFEAQLKDLDKEISKSDDPEFIEYAQGRKTSLLSSKEKISAQLAQLEQRLIDF